METPESQEQEVFMTASEMQDVHRADVTDVAFGRFSHAVLEAESWYPLEDLDVYMAPVVPVINRNLRISVVGSNTRAFSVADFQRRVRS